MTETVQQLARKAYPYRPHTQAHFVRGYLAARGDRAAMAELVGSYAEAMGATAAQRALL